MERVRFCSSGAEQPPPPALIMIVVCGHLPFPTRRRGTLGTFSKP